MCSADDVDHTRVLAKRLGVRGKEKRLTASAPLRRGSCHPSRWEWPFLLGRNCERPTSAMLVIRPTRVALSHKDAKLVGTLRPEEKDFTQMVSTANGVAAVAPVRLDKVEIGGMSTFE